MTAATTCTCGMDGAPGIHEPWCGEPEATDDDWAAYYAELDQETQPCK